MSMWDDLEKEAAKSGGGSDRFIKLKDGDSIVVAFLGEPKGFYKIFKDPTEYNSWVEGSSFRFKVNVGVLKDGEFTVQILEQGSTLAKAIAACRNKYGLENLFEIKRTGSGKEDTTYSCLFERALTDAEKETIKGLGLFPLDRQEKQDEMPERMKVDVPTPGYAPIEDDEDVPF